MLHTVERTSARACATPRWSGLTSATGAALIATSAPMPGHAAMERAVVRPSSGATATFTPLARSAAGAAGVLGVTGSGTAGRPSSPRPAARNITLARRTANCALAGPRILPDPRPLRSVDGRLRGQRRSCGVIARGWAP